MEQAFVNIKVGPKQHEIKFKLDTGSSSNVIPLYEYTKLDMQCTLQQTSRPLYGYGGERLVIKGKCNLKCKHKDIEMVMTFYVVDTNAPPVLGLKGCIDFGLIKMVLSVTETQTEVPVLEEFADVFKGIGLFPGECTIHLDPHATPVVHPPRRIPLALRSRLKEELENMERQGVIAKVTEPTEWVNSMVVAEKPRTGADRKFKLKKKREVERLEELKGHVAAQARLQVYSETVDPPLSLNPSVDPFFPSYQVPVSQALPAQPARPSQVRHPHEVKATKNPLLNPSMYTSCSVPQPATFSQIPVSQVYTPTALPLMQQASTTQAPATQAFLTSHEASNDLVRTLAEAITANRVPIPEPEIFKGDPLKYNDWKLSFFTLIDRKNLQAQEKLFFLRKYVGGSAKRAIEGHFLVGTETAYRAAWDILEDRFGNPFIVAKSYRDKIHAWHKISPKDSENLREFVDFLSSVESAMPYVQGLQTLNDCVENQRIALKLPDWLSSRWNREATIYQDGHKMFPDFRYFVRFLNMEARIACNPITSFYAVKSTDQERSKPTEREQSRYQRNQNFSAKTFTTNTSEKTSITCMFCKKKGHTLHRCLKIREKPVEERVKFVQREKLCFGCLRIGHNSRDCTSRSVCDLCGKRHPTCLHQDRGKKDQEQGDKNQQSETIENEASYL